MNKKRVRIKDIAEASGVSTGTVDRVIHNRGNVTPIVKAKVEKVMKALNYRPNIMASTLASNKTLRIAALLPDFKNDAFWESPYHGIQNAVVANGHFSIDIKPYFFDEKKVQTFVNQSNKILGNLPDALIIAPIFAKEAKQFLQEYEAAKLPYVLINTHLETENKTCYIGQDSYQSGVLAARLLSTNQPLNSTYLLLHLEEGEQVGNAAHIHQKEAGFYKFFEKNKIPTQIIKKAFNKTKNSIDLGTFLKNIIKEIPNPTGIFVSTSKAYQLVEHIGDKINNTTIIGFDLLPKNIDYLKTGQIDYLINQNPEKQGYLAVTNLIDFLLLKKAVKPIQYLPLDIVLKENVDYYLG